VTKNTLIALYFVTISTLDAKMNEKQDPVNPDRDRGRVISLPSRNVSDHPDTKEKYMAALLNFNMLEDIDHLLEAHFAKSKG